MPFRDVSATELITPGLVRDLAALGRVGEETSSESVLRRLITALVAGVPGCSGGSAELWRGKERVLLSASHSELITLAESEDETGDGPLTRARTTSATVVVHDVLHEPRRSRHTGMAIRCGVRSAVVIPIETDIALLLIALYSVRPAAFPEHAVPALAQTLTEQVTVALANMRDFDEIRTDAAQMQEALAGRAFIDQAKGIIMRASGCTADEAFEELRRISQRHQIKIADLARRLVREQENGRGTPA